MKRTGVTTRYWLATLALITLIWAAPGRAQSPSTTPQDRDDLTRQQLAAFDQFLDNHPELSEQLRKNPSLVDNQEFVANHPDLQRYLQEHPEVREDIDRNPAAVMHQEQRYDRAEDRDRDRDRDHDRDGITQGEVARMDSFLDSHPEIAEQLKKNPKLIDDKKWVDGHPELRQFLSEHSGIREEFDQHPYAFMRDENRYDRREDRGEFATMDQFLDKHPEVAEQLKKDPKLIDDRKWVAGHPELQEFMASHPEIRQQFDQHPYAFMRQEDRFDRREDRREDGRADRGDSDVTRGELSSFHEFLQGHDTIATELSKTPSLATNSEYLENHTALQTYLQSHPQVREELNENPQSFIKSAQGIGNTTPGTAPKTMPKMPGADPKSK